MIIFLDARGNIVTPPVPEPIGRGSNDANTIYIVAPLSSSANIYMTFTLPNGEALFGGLAENMRSSYDQADGLQASYLFTLPGSELSVWKYLVKSTVTRLSGVVQYTVVTVTSSMRATSPGTFTVSKGGRIKLPEVPTESAWDGILAQVGHTNEELDLIISTLFGDGEGSAGLVSKVESVKQKSDRNEKNINYASEKISAIREGVPCVSLHMEDTPLSVVLDEASTYLGGPPQAIVSGRALYNLSQDGVTAKKSTMIPPFSRVVFDLEKRQGAAYLQNRTVLFDIVGSYEDNTIRVLSDISVGLAPTLKGNEEDKAPSVRAVNGAILELEEAVFKKIKTENLLNPLEVVPTSYIAQNSADYGIPTENQNGWATSGFIECKKGDTFYLSLAEGETNELSLSYPAFHVAEYTSDVDGEKAIANSVTDTNTVVDKIYKSYTIINDGAKFFRFSFVENRGKYIITKNHKPTEYSEYVEGTEENYIKRNCGVDNKGKTLVVGNDGYISFEKTLDEIALAVKKINPKLNYKGTITHDELITVKSYNKNDAYMYVGENAMEVYNSIIRNGDIIVNDGGMSKWHSIGSVYDDISNVNNSHYDICIVGGGAGGIGAAYALKDSGYNVCLIEKLSTLGGTHCNAGVIDFLASPNPPFLNAIIEELYKENSVGKCYVEFGKDESLLYQVGEDTESTFVKRMRGSEINYGTAQANWGNDFRVNPVALQKVYERDLREGIDVLTNREVVGCRKIDNKIVNVAVYNSKDGTNETIWADYFIDCSADGVLCRFDKAEGVDFYIGADAKDLYNETSIASGFEGNKYEINTMGATYCVVRTEQSSPVFDVVDAKSNDNVYSAINAEWQIPPKYTLASTKGFGLWYVGDDGTEQGLRASIIDPDKYSDITPQDYIDNGYDYAYDKAKNTSKTHFVKKYGTDKKWNFVGLMPLLAMRETYRIKCDKMLTQNDIETLATSENIAENEYIALSSWWVDLHDNVSVDKSKIAFRQVFGIPYRCLVPTAFSNVLVGCRAFGASHIALSASRLTKTMMCLGYAAGKAMSLARESWLDDVRNINIGQLQSDCGVIDKMEELEKYFSLS